MKKKNQREYPDNYYMVSCSECKGKGVINTARLDYIECPVCNGEGEIKEYC